MPSRAEHSEPFNCWHCGSFYSMAAQRLDKIQSGIAICQVCQKTMKLWTGQQVFTFDLIRQADLEGRPRRNSVPALGSGVVFDDGPPGLIPEAGRLYSPWHEIKRPSFTSMS